MRTANNLLLMLALSTAPAFAQNADSITARQAAVRELFAARQEDKIMDAMIDVVAKDYVERLHQLHPDMAEDRLNALRTAISENLAATRDTYLAAETKMLSEKMTLADLNAVIAFYKTDAGKRISDIAVALIPDAGKYQMAWVGAAVHKATLDMNSAGKPAQ